MKRNFQLFKNYRTSPNKFDRSANIQRERKIKYDTQIPQ